MLSLTRGKKFNLTGKKKARQSRIVLLVFKSGFLYFATRVADKLPGPNKILLQHLMCVLHHILESADTNKMDAYNLSVCIAPTLLHLNGAQLDEQKEKIEKVQM